MGETEWRLLATLPDVPSAQSLAQILAAAGVLVRVNSDAGVLGQAAPSRIYVDATQLSQARGLLEPGQFSDEELERLASADPASGELPG